MKTDLLKKHIIDFIKYLNKEEEISKEQSAERLESIKYYKSWTKEKIFKMSAEDVYEYISKLWAMLIWGNKHYVVNKLIEEQGLEIFKKRLADFVWGKESVEVRWDKFRKNVKGVGPAMMSEILCKTHPNDFMIWNRRAYNALNLLGVSNLPVHNYQMNGKKYAELSNVVKTISSEMNKLGFKDPTLLAADYMLWHEFYADNLTEVFKTEVVKEDISGKKAKNTGKPETEDEAEFIHNDVRDAIKNIGIWLGFKADIEKKVADGSVVDAVWEASIGNMGRVMYVFEVQTKGSTDSLIVNLLKAKNNPAVQAIVAVSDAKQLEKIRKHSATIQGLGDKLKFWDYREVWKVHASLEYASEAINQLKLVPDNF